MKLTEMQAKCYHTLMWNWIVRKLQLNQGKSAIILKYQFSERYNFNLWANCFMCEYNKQGFTKRCNSCLLWKNQCYNFSSIRHLSSLNLQIDSFEVRDKLICECETMASVFKNELDQKTYDLCLAILLWKEIKLQIIEQNNDMQESLKSLKMYILMDFTNASIYRDDFYCPLCHSFREYWESLECVHCPLEESLENIGCQEGSPYDEIVTNYCIPDKKQIVLDNIDKMLEKMEG